MFLARHFWNALLDLAEVVGSLEGNEVLDVKSRDTNPSQPTFSSPLSSDSGHFRVAAPIELQHLDTSRVSQDSSHRSQNPQQDNVRHLRWQDNASMTIKELSEEAQARKDETRAAKRTAARAEAETKRQAGFRERHVRGLELEIVWMSNQSAQAAEEHETRLQRREDELVAQKEAAEKAAATAESRLREAQTKHEAEMSTARSKIETLQTSIDDRDTQIIGLSNEVEDIREAKKRVIEGKNDLYRAKLKAKQKVKKLKAKNRALDSKRKEAESKVSGAGGRAKGLQDQLRVSEKNAERWEKSCKEAEEDARDKVLSAYAGIIPYVLEESQQETMIASEETETSQLVELRKEMDELREENGRLTNKVKEWDEAWEAAVQGEEAWKEGTRRQYDEEKREALAQVRADDGTSSKPAAVEEEIRRECALEKDKALRSLRGHFTSKLKSHTNQELQKSRRRTSFERKMRSRVKKCPVKCVFKRAMSCAVAMEQSLIQKQLGRQFETEISNYKIRFEAEHARTRTQIDARPDQDEEVKKRDVEIEAQKSKLEQANKAKRQSAADLKKAKEENERLRRDAKAHESQKSLARQSKSEVQITLMTQDLIRASKLLGELSVMGLDQLHRELLGELLSANKVITDLRTSIEEGQSVDHEAFIIRMDLVMNKSDDFDKLDPRERPTLHSQLSETYLIIGSLSTILTRNPGDNTSRDLLEKIYGGKGKGKGKQGAMSVPAVLSGPSVASNGGRSAAPSPEPNGSDLATSAPAAGQQTGFSNNTGPTSTQTPNMPPSTITANPKAAESQAGPEDMDPATAHALQGSDETGLSALEDLDIDLTNPIFRNLDVEADTFHESNPATQIARGNDPSEGAMKLEAILTRLRNNTSTWP